MKVLSDTTEILIETWDDPGDYPSNAGAGPLPSYQYLDGIEGEVKLQLTEAEYETFLLTLQEESLDFWVSDVWGGYVCPGGVSSCKWEHEISGEKDNWVITLRVIEIEADPDWTEPTEDDFWDMER